MVAQAAPATPPVEDKDGDGVQDDVDDTPHQGGGHGKLGAAIGPDDGVEAVGEDEEGDADEDDVKIIHGIGQVVLRGPKGGQDAIPAQGEDRHQHGAASQQQDQGIAHAAVGALGIPLPLAEAEVGGAPVADHQGQGQGNDGDGKDHVGGPVAQVAHPPADEDLVDDVIQGRDQQGQGAGHSKLHHQPPKGCFG